MYWSRSRINSQYPYNINLAQATYFQQIQRYFFMLGSLDKSTSRSHKITKIIYVPSLSKKRQAENQLCHFQNIYEKITNLIDIKFTFDVLYGSPQPPGFSNLYFIIKFIKCDLIGYTSWSHYVAQSGRAGDSFDASIPCLLSWLIWIWNLCSIVYWTIDWDVIYEDRNLNRQLKHVIITMWA